MQILAVNLLFLQTFKVMRRSLVAISLFLSAAVTMAVGQEWKHVGDASAVIEAFNEANSKVTSIECSFRQEKYVSVRQIQDYKIDAYSDGKSYRLVLAPLRRKSGCIEAVIDAGDMSLASFRIMEGGQDYTEFIFTDKRIKVHE